jgi:hypothetical protein
VAIHTGARGTETDREVGGKVGCDCGGQIAGQQHDAAQRQAA